MHVYLYADVGRNTIACTPEEVQHMCRMYITFKRHTGVLGGTVSSSGRFWLLFYILYYAELGDSNYIFFISILVFEEHTLCCAPSVVQCVIICMMNEFTWAIPWYSSSVVAMFVVFNVTHCAVA